MYLPPYVQTCIDALEGAGYAAYAVGGCVRDSLLGLEPADYDLCTAALPEQTEAVFANCRLVLAGKKHGTVGVVTGGGVVEITTFRTEGAYLDNRHPEWVEFVSDVAGDLARRDFTVNAMAYSPTRGFADPFGGREDLQRRCLRCVGDPRKRFSEDALRILRGMRFSVRYGLTVEPETLRAMEELAPAMDSLARERVFEELSRFLPLAGTEDILRFAPLLERVIPELAPMRGFDQHSPYHAYDLLTHTARTVAGVAPTQALRWAALLHDIGKPETFSLGEDGRGHFYGHAALGAEMADKVLLRLKAPTALRGQVRDLIARHMTPLEPDRRILRRRLGSYGIQGTRDLLALQVADMGSKGTEGEDPYALVADLIDSILEEDSCLTLKDLAVDGRDMMALGMAPGPALGRALQRLLELVQEERVPNTKEALLRAAETDM